MHIMVKLSSSTVYLFMCFRANWIKYMGHKYTTACVLLLGIDKDLPHFGEIKNIYVVENRIMLEVYLHTTICYEDHFHAYEVRKTTRQQIIRMDDLHILYTDVTRKRNHKLYTMLHYHIVGL